MRFGILGALEVLRDGQTLELGGPQPRTVLALLLTASGRIVPSDVIIDALWGETPPASAAGTLQSYISRLRRALEPERARGSSESTLAYEPPGYRLLVDEDDVDFRRFERLAGEGRDMLDAGDASGASRTLTDAIALWRGPALLEFADLPAVHGVAARLDERRLVAIEDRVSADLALGRHPQLVAELGELVAEHPLREGLRCSLALALYRSGRQAEALRAIDEARRHLRDELGVEPGRPLRELEAKILAHDVALDPPRVRVEVSVPSGATGALVGRTRELDVLHTTFEEVTTASSMRIALIEGEPGIGKTRLAEAVAEDAAANGAHVFWGRSFEGGAAPALWPWLGVLRALVAARSADAGAEPAVAPALGPVLASSSPHAGGGDAAPAPNRFELFEAAVTTLSRHASERPTVVVLDDLQWADQASLELLAFLADSTVDAPVLVLGTVRELEVGRADALTAALASVSRRAGTARVHLRGLSPADTRALLETATGRGVGASTAGEVHQRADGNPFFITELAHLLEEDEERGDVIGEEVPAGVRDVVRRRLSQLPDGVVEMLRLAAVIGRDIELGLLTRASGRDLDECLDDLDVAVVHRLLGPVPDRPSTYRFSHALVRETLVDDLSALRRARHHVRIADAIEAGGVDDDNIEILAEHLWSAIAVGVSNRAADAIDRATEVALRRLAYESAEQLLDRLVQLRRAGTEPDAAEQELFALTRLAAVRRALHSYGATADITERAKDLARKVGRLDVLVDMLWAEWAAADTSLQLSRSEAVAKELLEIGQASGDPAARMVGHGVWGIANWHRGRITEACTHLDIGAELATQVVASGSPFSFDLEYRLLADSFQLYVHAFVGDRDDLTERFDALADAQRDRFPVVIVLGFACVAALIVDDLERAERCARRGLEADPNVSFTFWASYMQVACSTAELQRGLGGDDAIATAEHAIVRLREAGVRTSQCLFLGSFAIGLVHAGYVGRAQEVVKEAYAELEGWGELCFEPVVLLADAVVRHAAAELDAARGLVARARELATEQGSHALARRADAIAARLGL